MSIRTCYQAGKGRELKVKMIPASLKVQGVVEEVSPTAKGKDGSTAQDARGRLTKRVSHLGYVW